MKRRIIFVSLILVVITLACGLGSAASGKPVEPGGGTILFVMQQNAPDKTLLYAVNTDGSNLQPLLEVDYDTRPVLSPDRAQLALSLNDGKDAWLYVLDIAAARRGAETALRRLSPPAQDLEICFPAHDGLPESCLPIDGVRDVSPAWSPDGSKIAFSSNRSSDSPSSIYLIDAGGSNLRRLTLEPGVCRSCTTPDLTEPCMRKACDGETEPTWSPDGAQIAFVAERTLDKTIDHSFNRTDRTAWEIHSIRSDGSGEQTLAVDKNLYGPLLWTPDGTRILAFKKGTSSGDIFISTPAGREMEVFIRNLSITGHRTPAWSPDGRYLVYPYADLEGPDARIKTVKPDGSGDDTIAGGAFSGDAYQSPAWSLDGHHIVCQAHSKQSTRQVFSMIILNADGSGAKPIVDADTFPAGALTWIVWAK